MTHDHPHAPQAITINAAVVPGDILPEGCRQLQLVHEHGTLAAYTWAKLPQSSLRRIHKAVAYMIPVGGYADDPFVVTRFDWAPAMDVFSLLPDEFGLTEDVVFRCREVVDMLASPHLRRFLSDAFSLPDVFHGFWTAPGRNATANGRLAQEAVNLAHAIAGTVGISTVERDTGIVHALVRDMGLLWCSPDRGDLPVPHDSLHTLASLANAFDTLRKASPGEASDMHALLCADFKMPASSVLRSVLDRADRVSALLHENHLPARLRNQLLEAKLRRQQSVVVPFRPAVRHAEADLPGSR